MNPWDLGLFLKECWVRRTQLGSKSFENISKEEQLLFLFVLNTREWADQFKTVKEFFGVWWDKWKQIEKSKGKRNGEYSGSNTPQSGFELRGKTINKGKWIRRKEAFWEAENGENGWMGQENVGEVSLKVPCLFGILEGRKHPSLFFEIVILVLKLGFECFSKIKVNKFP